MARASAILCCCPPDKSPGNVFSSPVKLVCLSASATLLLISVLFTFLILSGNATFSNTFI